MNYRKIIAIAAVLTMMTSAVSCGSDSESSSGTSDTTSSVTSDEGKEDATEATDKSDKGESKSEKTTAKADDKTSEKTTEAKSAATTAAVVGGTGSSSSGGSSSGGNSSGGSSGGSAETNAPSGGGQSSETTTAEEEVKEYTAEIILGSTPKVTGSNVKVDGSVVTINAGGDYIFTGSVENGQICVDTGASEDKVTVVLNGVDIKNESIPAIFIKEAKRCTIKPKEGSVNNLESAITKKGNKDTGVIFSNDTVRLKGNGELNITATASHGIKSDDDVIIENGTYNINSRKSGIMTNVGVTVNGGNVTIFGGTNGMKAEGDDDVIGTININGGTLHISGGTKEEKHSIYAQEFNYNGGTVFAAGNKFTEPSTSATPYVGFGFKDGGKAGSELTFYVNGVEKGKITPHNDFMSAVMFLPELKNGNKVSISVDGKSMGEFEIADTQNVFVVG